MIHKQRADLTFKDNQKRGRHSWVRLTPAYSVKIVEQILEEHPQITTILEPFAGTGTTGLVASERGLSCDMLDINPFLVWLARVKCTDFNAVTDTINHHTVIKIIRLAQSFDSSESLWFPPISNIERWWSETSLLVLAKIFRAINLLWPKDCMEKDLVQIGFCRLLIQWSNVAFNHQSMSFKNNQGQLFLFDEEDEIYRTFLNGMQEIIAEASTPIKGNVEVLQADSRRMTEVATRKYDAVITSPPYANRMSYIRELRPYMYWLGYLQEASDAGEMDWQAIGGTWGWPQVV